jgi:hypothetical protein
VCCGNVVVGTIVSCSTSGAIMTTTAGICITCPTGEPPVGNTGFCQGASACLALDAGSTAGTCARDNAVVGCASSCDCPSGQVCCASHTALSAQTQCTTVAAGGSCPGAGSTGAQICIVSSECTNGQACVTQSCAGGTSISACGLQTQAPFYCDGGI